MAELKQMLIGLIPSYFVKKKVRDGVCNQMGNRKEISIEEVIRCYEKACS